MNELRLFEYLRAMFTVTPELHAIVNLEDEINGLLNVSVDYQGNKILKPTTFTFDLRLTQRVGEDEPVFINFKQTSGKPEAEFYDYVSSVKSYIKY